METRKHLPRAVLARIYFIDREIASGKYPNANDLAKGYQGTGVYFEIAGKQPELRRFLPPGRRSRKSFTQKILFPLLLF
jgi:hypothetical protein